MTAKVPAIAANAAVQILLDTTAAAFNKKRIRVWHLSRKKALEKYAEFTKECMAQRNFCHYESRLYRYAFRLGSRIRKLVGVGDITDKQCLIRLLYSMIDINVRFGDKDEIIMDRCYFSGCYSPFHCKYMSAMDAGIIAGIYGIQNGRLVFTNRITEGCGHCRAALVYEDNEDRLSVQKGKRL